MNPDTRQFEPVDQDTPHDWSVFAVGELLPLKGWWWRVTKCAGSNLTLTVDARIRPRRRLYGSGR